MKENKMKRLKKYLFVIGIFFPLLTFSQSTITKVLYYDSDWNKTENREEASFSRIITFKSDDYNFERPVGWVKDFYMPSGNLQWKGKYLFYDIDNEDNNINKGLTTWYFDSPLKIKSRESHYYSAKLEGKTTYWHENGEVDHFENYKNDLLDGTVEYFTDKGVIYKSIDYENGEIDGFIIDFHSNGDVETAFSFTNGILNPWHLEFDQWGDCKKVFKDNFSTNINDWEDNVFENYSCKINEITGKYIMKSFSKEGFCYPSVINIPDINLPFSDFVIETKVKNSTDNSYKILFGFQDWDNFSSLDLLQSESKLYFKVSRKNDGVKLDIVSDWKKIESFVNINDYNTFQLRQWYNSDEEEFRITLVVNGEVQGNFLSPIMKGFNFGYSICQDYNNLYVDYFEVRYPFKVDDNSFKRSSSVSCAGAGTGFSISSNGYIATNYHVIKECTNIFVKGIAGDTSAFPATVVLKDTINDLAILKVDKWIGTLPYEFNTNQLDVFDEVYAYGYPLTYALGDDIKATNGTITSLSAFHKDSYYQHTAPIQPGNSGGPLFDRYGNVVGVNTLIGVKMENVSASVKANNLTKHMYDLGISFPSNNKLKYLGNTEQYKLIKDYVYRIIVK
jgi:S1-C subfamily serine protease/antitoxin component YwqK of YwqJK toxin-antitoxin module